MLKFLLIIYNYFHKGIWKTRARDYAGPRRYFITLYKIIFLSISGFIRERISIRASALTLYTLLSIVPVMALLFGIAKGFGLESKLETWLLDQFPQQKTLLEQAVVFARRMLDDTRGGLVAGAGVAFLLYTVISVIGNIESAFNHIWSIAKSRTFIRKISDYLSLMLIGPFLAIAASGLNVYIATLVNQATQAHSYFHVFGRIAGIALGLSPFLLLWLLFSFLYIFLPNTKVRITSGLFGGAIAAIAYVITQTLYIKLQVGVSNANAIYGSFAALPLFLIWVQVSWNIVLFGAEWTDIYQNFESHENEEGQPIPSFRTVKRLSLGITQFIVNRFLKNEMPLEASQLAAQLRVPSRIMNDILHRLVAARILVEVEARGDDDTTYQPARDPRQLTPAFIFSSLENLGEEIEGGEGDAALKRFTPLLVSFEEALVKHPQNIPLSQASEDS
jgi:membrane protein